MKRILKSYRDQVQKIDHRFTDNIESKAPLWKKMIHPNHMDNTGFFALITFGGCVALFANYVVRPWGA